MGVGEEGDCPSNSKSLGGGWGYRWGGGAMFLILHTLTWFLMTTLSLDFIRSR